MGERSDETFSHAEIRNKKRIHLHRCFRTQCQLGKCLQTNLLLLEIVMLREYLYLDYNINERTKNYHYSSNIWAF